jgi:hypothetical protein
MAAAESRRGNAAVSKGVLRDIARMFLRLSATVGLAMFCGLMGAVIGAGMADFADEFAGRRAPLAVGFLFAVGQLVWPLIGAAFGGWLGWRAWRD